ncbi:MAG: HdeD family acid-resistance protein [Solirubrobacteraceae bacterium]
MSETSTAREQVRELGRLWWLPVLLGALSIVAGAIVLAKPDDSLATLAVIAGIFVIFDGLVELFGSFSKFTENRGLVALLGVLNLIVGILLIRHPIAGVTVIALFIGIWLVVVGTLRFIMAFEVQERRGWRLVVAAVEVIAGIVIVASPGIGFATLALLVGFAFIVNGVSMILMGLVLHAASRTATRSEPRRRPAR